MHKITRKQKKGLFNFLGTAIKYVTGNPDDTDLDLLKTHITAIESKQNEIIRKFNNQISFGLSLDTRFNKLLDKINNNNFIVSNAINKLSADFDGYAVLHNEIINLDNTNEFLMKLVRTITLSHLNISNIELFTLKELEILKKQLITIYSRKALLINDEHPYELIESSTTLICVTPKTMLIIVKIPIFLTNTFLTHRIYPIPNNEHIMILPPTSFYANNKWYEECKGEAEYIICTKSIKSKCQIPNVQNCTKTIVTENFYRETSKAVLLGIVHPTKIQEQEVKFSSLLMSDKPIIIEGILYGKKTIQEISLPDIVPIKLLPKHTLEIEKLKIPETHGQLQTIEETEVLPPISTGLSITALLLIIFVLAFLVTICIKKKGRISKILFGPKLQPAQVQILQELFNEAPKTSRTKINPKEGGEM